MDVDGTLTDGKIYMGENGELFKVFDIKDGYGIYNILPKRGIITVIVTGRTSKIVLQRSEELKIDYVFQNVKDKKCTISQLLDKLEISLSETAYIGDDVVDLPAMKLCKVKGCPVDASCHVKEICDFVSDKKGGEGAVRDFIEWLLEEKLI